MPTALETATIHAAIIKFCADNPSKPGERPAPNGNIPIQQMLLSKFHILYTTGQVAGMVTRLGINRGGISHKNPVADDQSWAQQNFPAMLAPNAAARERKRIDDLPAPMLRRCTICQTRKPIDLFGRHPDGTKRDDCLACVEVAAAKPTKYDNPAGHVIASDRANQTKKQKAIDIGVVAYPASTLPEPTSTAKHAPGRPSIEVQTGPQSVRHRQAVASAIRDPNHISPFNNNAYRPVIREDDDPFGIFTRLPEVDVWPHICQFPQDDPGSPGFRFCGDRQHPGRPYCRPHCEIAYNGFDPYKFQELAR